MLWYFALAAPEGHEDVVAVEEAADHRRLRRPVLLPGRQHAEAVFLQVVAVLGSHVHGWCHSFGSGLPVTVAATSSGSSGSRSAAPRDVEVGADEEGVGVVDLPDARVVDAHARRPGRPARAARRTNGSVSSSPSRRTVNPSPRRSWSAAADRRARRVGGGLPAPWWVRRRRGRAQVRRSPITNGESP